MMKIHANLPFETFKSAAREAKDAQRRADIEASRLESLLESKSTAFFQRLLENSQKNAQRDFVRELLECDETPKSLANFGGVR